MTQFNLFAVLAVIAGLGLVTFAVVTMTSFVKIAVVLFLIRNALGVQQTPPNLVLYAIALVLTAYVSAPLVQAVYERVNDRATEFQTFADWKDAAERATQPVREHLSRFTTVAERDFFVTATGSLWPDSSRAKLSSEDLVILVPSFMSSELKRAFEIGFLLYLPFIAIDLVVSAVLMSLGMSMVPPSTISVPFKLFLFVMVEGWSKLMHGLVLSYG
ncbi:type III secretion system protein YscR [Bradyrhizobium oligotrophicum S58]|uniref:Type III secretion system protein YscR n=1 Tax=Bradyrhizobium oligotrophicum S58 TaxID=1245469 RepID=M4ZH86_9BRAD|nr:type III secretion system export apparatus subunit SctR [Bradyrhizobium oligotrophicum]BAM93183.1 type III secretion system protein YscR [Bradyrhizobium oligotrophicum S58]